MDLIRCLIILRESNGGDSALQKISYPVFEISLKSFSCIFLLLHMHFNISQAY
jgi:hypothetical protein